MEKKELADKIVAIVKNICNKLGEVYVEENGLFLSLADVNPIKVKVEVEDKYTDCYYMVETELLEIAVCGEDNDDFWVSCYVEEDYEELDVDDLEIKNLTDILKNLTDYYESLLS